MPSVKYISTTHNGCLTIFVFPGHIGHDEFVARLGCGRDKVKSAGFVDYVCRDGVMVGYCYGRSVSLDIVAADGDSLLLTKDYFGIDAVCALNIKNNYK